MRSTKQSVGIKVWDIMIPDEGSNGRKETGIDMQKKERMANLEVLRCVAMMMVVVLHYLGKGGLLPDLTAPLSVQATAAEASVWLP